MYCAVFKGTFCVPYVQKYQKSGLHLIHLDWKELRRLSESWMLPVSDTVTLASTDDHLSLILPLSICEQI